VLNKSIN